MKNTRTQIGLTLIELLVTLAVLGVILSFALPNVSYLINSNATASQTNHFSSAISLARSEAIKRNVPVMICKRSGTTCDNSGDWEDGWIIFADLDADDTLDSGEEIRYIDGLRNNYTLRPSVAAINWLAFQSDGKVETNNGAFAGVTFRLCDPDADITESRSITFNVIGQARLSKGSTTCP